MPREYCNESEPDNYVICEGNSNLCILNKFSSHKTFKGILLMKNTKKHLSDLGINHTAKKKDQEGPQYQLSFDLLPNS